MGHVEPAYPNQLTVIVVKKEWNMVAVLVDEIIGEKEIVIKSLRPPLANVACVSGGTLSSNGQVMIVINIKDLIAAALHSSKLIGYRYVMK